jgi:hypothetical protein
LLCSVPKRLLALPFFVGLLLKVLFLS